MKSLSPHILFATLELMALIFTGDAHAEQHQAEAWHFGYQTENGQQRSENITYMIDPKEPKSEQNDTNAVKPVEYRGGYSFISADGYEYQVLYKANKNGFQPYVTAHKIQGDNPLNNLVKPSLKINKKNEKVSEAAESEVQVAAEKKQQDANVDDKQSQPVKIEKKLEQLNKTESQ